MVFVRSKNTREGGGREREREKRAQSFNGVYVEEEKSAVGSFR